MADHKYTNTLEIESNGGKVEYVFETTGLVNGEKVDDHDTVREKGAEGHCWNGTDVYSYNGSLKGINWGDDSYQYATVRVNGREQAGFHVNCRKVEVTYPDFSGSKVPYTIAARGGGGTTIFGSGSTEESGPDNPYANSEMADGMIGGGTDTWYVAGFFLGIDSNQNVKATVDDEKVFRALGTPPTGI